MGWLAVNCYRVNELVTFWTTSGCLQNIIAIPHVEAQKGKHICMATRQLELQVRHVFTYTSSSFNTEAVKSVLDYDRRRQTIGPPTGRCLQLRTTHAGKGCQQGQLQRA